MLFNNRNIVINEVEVKKLVALKFLMETTFWNLSLVQNILLKFHNWFFLLFF